ncbi:hypothetical protein [Natrinema versiforme]|uniref:PGF-CTERM sorting domain-containing protein n=1 Tax=Natrinema versiforme TaxID=88724 RepID=A0A4V1FZZ1_9EURY|nr:hypothetical protein [Natrinema versiforme]QCS43526.1 hypothetical protein FEJ81_14650 [Natrinema versiforme]
MARHDADPSVNETGQGRTPTDESNRDAAPSRRWKQPVAALLVALAIGVAIVPIASMATAGTGTATATPTAAGPDLVVDDAAVESGETATHRLALTDAPDGLAGFELTVELSGDGDTATVANASYPDQYGPTTDPVVSADGRSVTLEAVDLTDEVTPGASDVTLATVEVNGTDTGSTALEVTELQIDADGGDRIEPSLEAGTLTVDGGSASQNETGDSDDGTGSDGLDSVPGFTGGAAVAVIAALAVALLARSR